MSASQVVQGSIPTSAWPVYASTTLTRVRKSVPQGNIGEHWHIYAVFVEYVSDRDLEAGALILGDSRGRRLAPLLFRSI